MFVMSSSEESLVSKASHGDPVALDQLLIENLPRLEAYMRLKTGEVIKSKESCTDLVQSVCREVLEELPSFEYRGESAFRHWLLKRAFHKIVDRARFYRIGARGADAGLSGVEASAAFASWLTPSREAASREELRLLELAFADLPADYRDAVILHKLVGLQHKEIAAELGKSEGAVRNLLYRGLARLALALERAT